MGKKKKVNPHKVLGEYQLRREYPQIAKQAADWVRANPDATAHTLRQWVEERFGPEQWLTMQKRAAPLQIFGTVGQHIPPNAVDQMYTVLRLPMATRGALMPDAHYGYAMPIGGVAALEGAISPSFVGYDISCMMQLTVFDLPPEEFMAQRVGLADTLQGVTSFGAGGRVGDEREHEVMEDPAWSELPLLARLRDLAQSQLGSSGGGNHFADLVLITFLADEAPFAAGEEAVGLLTHSGSRGTGHKIARHYVARAEAETRAIARGIPTGYEWLPLGSELAQEYLTAMGLMGRYARANHDLIHDHFLRAVGATPRARVWNRHNFAWVDEASGEVLHRKGATPADSGRLGLIPGTSGSDSFLVRGLGNPASLHSSSHGAGRMFSRTQAKKQHNERAFQLHMAERDILHVGLAPDESPFAYKDIETVIALQEGVLVETVARMTPRVVLMGSTSDDGE